MPVCILGHVGGIGVEILLRGNRQLSLWRINQLHFRSGPGDGDRHLRWLNKTVLRKNVLKGTSFLLAVNNVYESFFTSNV